MAVLVSAVSTQAFANENVKTENTATKFVQQQNKQAFEQKRAQKEAEFEKKLGLTDEQKVQIKEFRKKSSSFCANSFFALNILDLIVPKGQFSFFEASSYE